jgi:hypothetical protein
MSLSNGHQNKLKKLILITVLLLTVSFGVFGGGGRANAGFWEGVIRVRDAIGDAALVPFVAGYNLYQSGFNYEEWTKRNKDHAQAVKEIGDAQREESAATLSEILGAMVAWVLYYIAVGIGWIFMLVAEVMLKVAVFNTFVKQPIVQQGWIIVRTICNNFFIIFLMILAVQVTLNLEANKWRSKLFNILLFAVLINFSLTIVGILIDVSQVLMLTFASPLAGQMGKNLILAAMGLPEMLKMEAVVKSWSDNQQGISWLDIIAALIFAIIVSIVALVVVVCITAILIWRIVMLIFLCILSPLPFLSRAGGFGTLKSIEGEFISKLSNMLIVGPAMMFFLYLSFLMMAASVKSGGSMVSDTNVDQAKTELTQDQLGVNPERGQMDKTGLALSGMASVEGLFKFMVVVGFLVGSLMMGRKFGDAAGSIAGKGMNMLSSGAKKFSGFNLASKVASATPGFVGKKIGQKAGTVGLGLATGATRFAAKVTGSGKEGGLTKLADFGGQWRKDVLESRRNARRDKMTKFMGKMGVGEKGFGAWGQFTDTDFAKRGKEFTTIGTSLSAAAGMAFLTGGIGLIPGLAALAGGYVGGGGRLMEMALGDSYKSRQEAIKKDRTGINKAAGEAEKERRDDQDLGIDSERIEKNYIENLSRSLAEKVNSKEISSQAAKGYLNGEIAKIEADIKVKIEEINQDTTKTEPQKQTDRDKENQRRQNALDSIKHDFDDNVYGTGLSGKASKAVSWAAGKMPSLPDKAFESFEPYAHPNWVSQAVAKKALAESEKVKDTMSLIELGNNDMLDDRTTFGSATFYSGSGQTAQQFKTFEALNSSAKGIEQMVKVLTSLPTELKGDRGKVVEELKRGLAAFSKGGGDTSKLSPLINALDTKVIVRKNGEQINKSIKEYEGEVKEKK